MIENCPSQNSRSTAPYDDFELYLCNGVQVRKKKITKHLQRNGNSVNVRTLLLPALMNTQKKREDI